MYLFYMLKFLLYVSILLVNSALKCKLIQL